MNVVTVTPAGRIPHMEILHEIIELQRKILGVGKSFSYLRHEYWVNTEDKNSINWMKSKEDEFYKVVPCPIKPNGAKTIKNFFPNATDENTIYIRFDDDIVWLSELSLVMMCSALRSKKYGIVSSYIVNNSICSHLFQRFGIFDFLEKNINYNFVDENGWANGKNAIRIHREFLARISNSTDKEWILDKDWVMNYNESFSVNLIGWIGSDMKTALCYHGINHIENEELWLSNMFPNLIGKKNAFVKNTLASHFAYHVQREMYGPLGEGILDEYREIYQIPHGGILHGESRASRICGG